MGGGFLSGGTETRKFQTFFFGDKQIMSKGFGRLRKYHGMTDRPGKLRLGQSRDPRPSEQFLEPLGFSRPVVNCDLVRWEK